LNSPDKIPFKLLFITDSKLSEKNLSVIVNAACSSGLKAVQIREKDMPAKDLLKLAQSIRLITVKYKASLIINDRLDIALLSKANAIHVPQNGIPLNLIQKFALRMLAGKSVHSISDAIKAQKEGYDYLLFGPVFKTPAKIKYGRPQGLGNLKKICKAVNIPVFAVGGITPNRARICLQSGAYGVAVIRAIMKSSDIRKTINEFKIGLGEL
jgi:thiamine-phosphate pyrophosphorylase